MGAWGSGLYSSDYALDLRATIAALSKLPFEGEIQLKPDKVPTCLTDDAIHFAVSNVSISNRLDVTLSHPKGPHLSEWVLC